MIINTIIFDLGKVLLDFDFNPFYNWIENHTPYSKKDVLNFLKQNHLIKNYELGYISTKEFFTILKDYLRTSYSIEHLQNLWNRIFSIIDKNYFLLQELYYNKQKYNLKLALLSNTNESHKIFIEKHFVIFSYFDYKIFSFEIHLEKPEPEIYQYTLDLLNTKPENTIFIDDKLENIEGAKSIGIHSIHYKPTLDLKNILKYQYYIPNFSKQTQLF
ncbi:MAG: haloacid dehalogenase [Leptospiraceae bacterium]|nr:MAG: haloacid dehalogenase [Leptospiraceae bacterium]